MKLSLRSLGGAFLLTAASFGFVSAQSNTPIEPSLSDGIDIQVRGPIHEAYAQPSDLQPQPGEPVPKQPPAPIPEEPPEERPEGVNVQFIPGYWAWDAETSQFMWVSGTYRNVPPGRQWVAGYWVNTPEGWRWVPGFWAPEQQQDLQYTPEPPAPLQVEPSVPPPDDDYSWVPGTWVYREPRFVWRPGYWSPFRAGRLWVGARYLWTPSGYLFNDGYWDYPLEDRGLLFAPVVFHRPFWDNPGWCWRPSFVVGCGSIFDSCFTRFGGSHFYYGNYYGSNFAGLGYRPWFDGRGRYDSTFAHHRWNQHQGRQWYAHQQQLYRDRGAGRAPAPARTLAQQNAILANRTAGADKLRVVAPLSQVHAVNGHVKLTKTTPAQLATQKALSARAREISQLRAKSDSIKTGGFGGPSRGAGTTAFKLPPSVKGTATTRDTARGTPGPALANKAPTHNPLSRGGSKIAGVPKVTTGLKSSSPPGSNQAHVRSPSANAPFASPFSQSPQRSAPRTATTPSAPRSWTSMPSQPKITTHAVPRSAPSAAHQSAGPRYSAPAPRYAPAQRYSSAPRSAPAMRFSAPQRHASAPRPAAPRSAPSHGSPSRGASSRGRR